MNMKWYTLTDYINVYHQKKSLFPATKVIHVHFKQLNTCHLVLAILKKKILMSRSYFSYAIVIYLPLKKNPFL